LVFIRKSKTGYQRQVPISETLKTIFERYLQTRILFFSRDNNYFLIGLKGKLTANGSIPQILNKLAKEAQISKRIHPHLLRHSIATHLLQNGMPLDKVSQFLGHKNIGSTQRYTHL
jgi:site-specific recombinase XerD